MKKIKKTIWKMLVFLKIDILYLLTKNSGLEKRGWFRSYYSKKSVDKNGNPLPWYTYPFLDFLEKRINNSMDVFEYGCGNSTIWYSKKVREVISVEQNEKWFNEINDKKEKNCIILLKKDPKEYREAIKKFDKKFDIIVVDAIERVECVRNSLEKLKSNGIILFDNSDRKEYEKAYTLLVGEGFKRLDFWGMGPINYYEWCTSVFYKENNCLNI